MVRDERARTTGSARGGVSGLALAVLTVGGCGVATDPAGSTDGATTTAGDTGGALEIPAAPPGPDCSARDCGAHGRCVVVGERARCRCDEGWAADEAVQGPCVACPEATDDPIVRDLVPVALTGQITVDGVSLAGDTINQGVIELVGEREGDRIPLGSVQSGSYEASVLPGTYDLDFAFGTQGNLVPSNQRVRLRDAVKIDADRQLDVDVKTATVTGIVTIAGRPVLDDPADYGVLYLIDQRTGGEVLLGPTFDGDYFVRVAHGTYDLVYEWAASFEHAPTNSNVTLVSGVDIDGPTELDVDVPAVTLDGQIRLANRFDLPPDLPIPLGSSAAVLRSVDDGSIVRLGSSEDVRYEVRLMPGTYEVLIEPFVPGPGAPLNPTGRLWSAGELQVDGDRSFDIEIPTLLVSGSITVAGVGLYDPQDYGDLFLRDVHEDRLVPLGPSFAGSYAVEVLPGRYEVIYAGRASRGIAPLNPEAVVVDDLAIVDDTVLDIDVPSVRLQGEMTVSPIGEPGPSAVLAGDAILLDRRTGAELVLGPFIDERYDVAVVPGRYDVMLRGSSIAHTRRRLIDDLEVSADTVRDLEVRPLRRRFEFSLDGQPPVSIVGANFYLRSDDEGSDARLDLNTDTDLLTGSYWLEYEGTGNSVEVQNRRVRLECLTLAP